MLEIGIGTGLVFVLALDCASAVSRVPAASSRLTECVSTVTLWESLYEYI